MNMDSDNAVIGDKGLGHMDDQALRFVPLTTATLHMIPQRAGRVLSQRS